MSRASRDSLLANDSLAGSSDAAYSDLGGVDSERRAGNCGGTLSSWWRNPRKRLYLIGISLIILLVLIAAIAFAYITREEADKPQDGPTTPPDNPETPWLYPRLPDSVLPSHYSLVEEINVADFQYRGSVNITVNVTRPVDHILLHVLGLTWLEVTLTLDNGTVLTPIAWLYDQYDYLVLNFTSMVPVQRAAVLHVGFAATLISYPYAGLYASNYKNSTGGTVYMAATQFAATDARRAFPCFDEPAMKATFDVTIINDPAWPTVLSNMPAVSASTRPSDGWLVTTFATTPVMSTYLLAFTVNDFQYTTAMSSCSRPITSRVYAPPHLLSWTNTTVLIAADVISHYCSYFQADYPLPKEDHFVVPQFFYGAMENWGLIAYRFTALLLQPNEYTVDQLLGVARIVAHELAHQWFGNLVTAAWWSESQQQRTRIQLEQAAYSAVVNSLSCVPCAMDVSAVWLNEGFASFVQYVGLEWAVPALDARDQFLIVEERTAMLFDSSPRAHPIIDPTTRSGNFDQFTQQTHTLLLIIHPLLLSIAPLLTRCARCVSLHRADYQRGASLLRMLQGVLGPAVWLNGIQAYLQSYKYSNARSVDLFAHLTQAAKEAGQSINVTKFMAEWTQVAGFPLLSCTTKPSTAGDSTEWQCTQQRYYANPPPDNPDTTTAWDIYLTFAGTPIAPVYWPNTQPTLTFTVPSTTPFTKLNANSTGYFRVMYDEYGWQQLARALNASDFGGMSADDRLGVVMDAFVFAWDERLRWATLLPLLHFLQYETSALSPLPLFLSRLSCAAGQLTGPLLLRRVVL